jgi:hypothetical protein
MLFISDKGEVFGWGNSEYGQFRSVTEDQQINRPVNLHLKGIGKIIDVASGGTICMVLNGNLISSTSFRHNWKCQCSSNYLYVYKIPTSKRNPKLIIKMLDF